MQTRPLALFMLCLAVVAVSGAVALVTASGWLHEPGAQLFGVRGFILIWIVVLVDAPVLAAVSVRSANAPSGLAGTLAGAAAATLLSGVASLLGLVFFVAGVVGLPVTVEFWIVSTLFRIRGRGPDQGGSPS